MNKIARQKNKNKNKNKTKKFKQNKTTKNRKLNNIYIKEET